MIGRTATALSLALVLAGPSGCERRAEPQVVRVMAAASTREAVEEIAGRFTGETGAEVRIIAESSAKLAMQIVHDAPADLFLSANDRWADFVMDKGYGAEMTPLLTNRLALIVPRGNPARVRRPDDLSGGAVKHVALAGPSVPAGIYGRQALHKLGLLDRLEAARKIVSGDDVRVTLAFVERGEADAGMVYDTDARITDRVEIVHLFDPSTHDPIRYPLVLLRAARDRNAARRLFAFMRSPPAAGVFRRHGFETLAGK